MHVVWDPVCQESSVKSQESRIYIKTPLMCVCRTLLLHTALWSTLLCGGGGSLFEVPTAVLLLGVLLNCFHDILLKSREDMNPPLRFDFEYKWVSEETPAGSRGGRRTVPRTSVGAVVAKTKEFAQGGTGSKLFSAGSDQAKKTMTDRQGNVVPNTTDRSMTGGYNMAAYKSANKAASAQMQETEVPVEEVRSHGCVSLLSAGRGMFSWLSPPRPG